MRPLALLISIHCLYKRSLKGDGRKLRTQIKFPISKGSTQVRHKTCSAYPISHGALRLETPYVVKRHQMGLGQKH